MPFQGNDSDNYLFVFNGINHPRTLVYPSTPKA